MPHLDEIPSQDAWDQESEHVPLQVVLDLFNQVAGPLLNGLAGLYAMGFTRLYLHCVPPPTLSDAEFEWMNRFYTPARLRYKAALLFNSCFASFCRQYKIGFIDIWDQVTINGALNPDFYLDGCHLNPRSVPITLDKLMTRLAVDSRVPVEPRYEFALEQARTAFTETGAPVDMAVRERWSTGGIVTSSVPTDAVERLREGLEYEGGVANRHVRLDWNGAGIESWPPHISTAEPGRDTLAVVHDLVYSQPLVDLLQSCQQSDFAVVSARFWRIGLAAGDEAGPEQLHTDDCPPGAIRCWVYLTDVDAQSSAFEYADEAGAARRIEGSTGTTVVFDGKRVQHRWACGPVAPLEVLDLVLIPRHGLLSRCVIWAGMNNWPVDPYNFSLDGFRVFPEETGTIRVGANLRPEELLKLRLESTED